MRNQTTTHSPLARLEPSDRQLLNLAFDQNLNLTTLVAPNTDHPARANLLAFLEWFAQPHIAAAADHLAATLAHIDSLTESITRKTIRAGLENVFQSCISLTNVLPPSPQNAQANNRLNRESRLVAAALKRLSSNPTSRRKPKDNTLDTADDSSANTRNHPQIPQSAPAPIDSPHHTLSLTTLIPNPLLSSSRLASPLPTAQSESQSDLNNLTRRAPSANPSPASRLAAVSGTPLAARR